MGPYHPTGALSQQVDVILEALRLSEFHMGLHTLPPNDCHKSFALLPRTNALMLDILNHPTTTGGLEALSIFFDGADQFLCILLELVILGSEIAGQHFGHW